MACVTEDEDPAEEGTGGAPGTGGAESGGTGAGGSTATGGAGATTSTGGSSGELVACPPIGDALLLDFSENDGSQATFGIPPDTFAGGTYVYPDALGSDTSAENWHISGTVSDYTGFGFYFQDGCDPLDASAYNGFHFTISGTLPADRSLTMWIATSNSTIPADWLLANTEETNVDPNSGTCIPNDNQWDGTCSDAEAVIPVTADAQTIELNWTDFTGGSPDASPVPSIITRFGFYFEWAGNTDTAYEVDVTLDDFGFIE